MGSPTLNIRAVATTNNSLVSVLCALINCPRRCVSLVSAHSRGQFHWMMSKGNSLKEDPWSTNGHLESFAYITKLSRHRVQNGTSNVLFSSQYFDVYGIETRSRSNPDISGLVFCVGSRAHSLFPAAASGGTDTFPFLWAWFGEEESGYRLWWKWLKEPRAGMGIGDLGQKAINQADNSPEHQDSHLQEEPRDILWPRATLAPQFLHLKK